MKRFITAIIAILALSVNVAAQVTKKGITFFDFYGFRIVDTGEFKTRDKEDPKDFLICKYKGYTAEQIYNEICSNAAKVYVSPKDVMSTVPNISVSIRAYKDDLIYVNSRERYPGYYKLLIEIRDERVKVHAPVIEGARNTLCDYFESNGDIKKKRYAYKGLTETGLNDIYEKLLGKDLASRHNNENDW